MNTLRLSLGLAFGLGLGLASVGCLEVPEEDGVYIDALDREAMDNPTQGSGSENHLGDESFHLNKFVLRSAAARPLGAIFPSPHNLNTLSNGMTSTPEAEQLLEYAVRCALPSSDWIYYGSPATMLYGQGLLTTTQSWRTGALTTSQTEDLFACLALHINPAGAYVDIMLSGASVTNSVELADYQADYPFIEALWTADVVSAPLTPSITINVWPQQDLITKCQYVVLDEEVKSRVCGTPAGGCGLAVRTDLTTACSLDVNTGDYTCDGKPAILTRLPTSGSNQLYPKCTHYSP